MATFTEAVVKISIDISRDSAGAAVVGLSAQSFLADGTTFVREKSWNVTAMLSPERIAGIMSLLADGEAYAKQQLQIP